MLFEKLRSTATTIFLQRNLARLLKTNCGQYALLKSARVVEFYEGPGEAYRAGLELFSDRLFSIQKITDEPVELGLMSVAIA